MAVAFSPNFVGDRCLVVVGALPGAGAGVDFQILNTATNAVVRTVSFVPAATTGDLGQAAGIVSADIALPSDFDPTTGSGQRAYVCVGTAGNATTDDVYRIDGGTYRALGAVTTLAVQSVSYSGTIDEGTLFMGERGAPNVRYTTNPAVALPTWLATKKAPTGTANALTVVRVASDFATSNRVFAGTSGAESAFSVSNNGGTSFDGESLIDSGANNIGVAHDVRVSADGATIFVAALDGNANLTLWRSATPVSAASWSRILCRAGTAALVRLNPDWATTPAVYFADVAPGGNIYVSTNGGGIFATRLAPTGVTLTDLAVTDGTILYLGDGAGNVYKSTTGAWTWGLPVSAKAGAVVSLDLATDGTLLVGGTGACSYSTDGGASFTRIATELVAGNGYIIAADEDFTTNSTIYAGDAVTGNIYRFVISESSAWVSLGNPTAAPILGMASLGGTLYGMSAASCDRNVNPLLEPGIVARSWDTMNAGAAPAVIAAAGGAVAVGMFDVAPGTSNVLYAAGAGPALWAYNDWLATTPPTITAPADGCAVPVDPVSGRADVIYAVWEPMGTGAGMVNQVSVQVWETALGSGAAATRNGLAVSGLAPRLELTSTFAGLIVFKANTEYSWRVRAWNTVSGDNIRSPWSETRTFTVEAGGIVQQPHAGPVLLGPQGGATDVSLTPGFSWAPISGATEYEFILATDAGLTNTVAGTPVTVTSPAFQVTEPLEYSTTYFWAVRAIAPTQSPRSIGTFTTMAEPVEPTPPVVVEPTPPAPQIVPGYIYAIIGVGAVLVIAVLVLIVRTRRP